MFNLIYSERVKIYATIRSCREVPPGFTFVGAYNSLNQARRVGHWLAKQAVVVESIEVETCQEARS